MHLGECKHARVRCQQLFCLFMSQHLEPSTAHSPLSSKSSSIRGA